MKRFIATVERIIFALIILLVIFFGVLYLPIENNFRLLLVSAGSMEPTIHMGSFVLIKPASTYTVGDVIVYKKAHRSESELPTAHRIVNTEVVEGEIQYVTKGDANEFPDMELIRKSEVWGKVYLEIIYGKQITDFVKSPLGFTLTILLPLVLIGVERGRHYFKRQTI